MKETTTKTLQPGSYSTGTCNPAHLAPRFSQILYELGDSRWEWLKEFERIPEDDADGLASEIVNDMIDAISEHCPDGHYFGAHPGDGADFGVWPFEDYQDAEPSHDDSVKYCPDCEQPNQFGELCESCRRERQNVARGDDIPDSLEP